MQEILLLVAKYLYLIVGLAAVTYWLTVSKQEKLRLVAFGAVAAIVTIILVKVGASLFYDTRPFVSQQLIPLYPHGADNGFPSDHTVLSAFIALTIFSSTKRLGTVLLLASVLIGISRVIGHIHSPIDIVGSLVFAFVGFGIATRATPYIINRFNNRHMHISSN